MQATASAPNGFVRGTSVAALFGEAFPTVERGIRDIVTNSFRTRPMRNITRRAIAERIVFCVGKAGELRSSLGWGAERIIDTLPAALTAHLDRRDWKPSTRKVWVPEDGA